MESTRIGRRVRPDTKESQKQKSNQVFRPEGSKSADAPSAFPFGSVNRIQFSEPFCMTQEGGVQEKKKLFYPASTSGSGPLWPAQKCASDERSETSIFGHVTGPAYQIRCEGSAISWGRLHFQRGAQDFNFHRHSKRRSNGTFH